MQLGKSYLFAQGSVVMSIVYNLSLLYLCKLVNEIDSGNSDGMEYCNIDYKVIDFKVQPLFPNINTWERYIFF